MEHRKTVDSRAEAPEASSWRSLRRAQSSSTSFSTGHWSLSSVADSRHSMAAHFFSSSPSPFHECGRRRDAAAAAAASDLAPFAAQVRDLNKIR